MTNLRTDLGFALLPLLLGTACSAAPGSTDETQTSAQTAQEDHADRGIVALPAPPAVAARPTCSDADGRYKVIDEFVVDHANGARVWQRFVPDPLFTQEEAAAYCAHVTLGRRTVWRVPTAAELVSIELRPAGLKGGPQTCAPAIDQTAFPSTPATPFWTSTTRTSGANVEGISVGFDDGRSHPTSPDTKLNVRCVTDP